MPFLAKAGKGVILESSTTTGYLDKEGNKQQKGVGTVINQYLEDVVALAKSDLGTISLLVDTKDKGQETYFVNILENGNVAFRNSATKETHYMNKITKEDGKFFYSFGKDKNPFADSVATEDITDKAGNVSQKVKIATFLKNDEIAKALDDARANAGEGKRVQVLTYPSTPGKYEVKVSEFGAKGVEHAEQKQANAAEASAPKQAEVDGPAF